MGNTANDAKLDTAVAQPLCCLASGTRESMPCREHVAAQVAADDHSKRASGAWGVGVSSPIGDGYILKKQQRCVQRRKGLQSRSSESVLKNQHSTETTACFAYQAAAALPNRRFAGGAAKLCRQRRVQCSKIDSTYSDLDPAAHRQRSIQR